eukprot:GHVN01025783.1.p1 GENE.GHVN01025783.1~~GHVN01025783.1.p1  ORF type:complete len:239 (+),score=28.79 GHVN01025783.1:136-852(+)
MAFEYIGPTSKAALDHGFTILHSLIARNAFIVAEYSPLCNEESEMVAEVCRDALNRLPPTGNGDCYVYENKKFSYIRSSNFVFLCVTTMNAPKGFPERFLKDVRSAVALPRAPSASFSQSTEQLTRLLHDRTHQFNQSQRAPCERESEPGRSGDDGEDNNLWDGRSDEARFSGTRWENRRSDESRPYADRMIQVAERELGNVAEVMKDNIGKVVARGEQIASLVTKSESLAVEVSRNE